MITANGGMEGGNIELSLKLNTLKLRPLNSVKHVNADKEIEYQQCIVDPSEYPLFGQYDNFTNTEQPFEFDFNLLELSKEEMLNQLRNYKGMLRMKLNINVEQGDEEKLRRLLSINPLVN